MGYELNVAGKIVKVSENIENNSAIFEISRLKDCGAPCNSLFFDENERTTLRYWTSSWAAISVASCLFTVKIIFLASNKSFLILQNFIYHFSTDSHFHHRLISIPLPWTPYRFSRHMLPDCWYRLCLWSWRWRYCCMSWTISTSRKIGAIANDFHDYTSEIFSNPKCFFN